MVCTKTAAVSHDNTRQHYTYTTSVDIYTQQHSESARERRKALYKSDQQLELDLGQQETSEKHIMQYLMTVDHSIISWMLFY